VRSRFRNRPKSDGFGRALDRARAVRPKLAREAASYVMRHYRLHRELPPKPALALLSVQQVSWIVVRGEFEHRLGLIVLVRFVVDLNRTIRRWLAQRARTR